MAKGYWIARVDVSDVEAYQAYVRANAGPLGRYGARFLVRGGDHVVVEGSGRQRNVVLEFPLLPGSGGLLSFSGISGREGLKRRHCRGRPCHYRRL